MSETEQGQAKRGYHGGRKPGAVNAPKKYATVKWKYTMDTFREEWDPETDGIVKKPVEDFEKKVYKERVRLEEITRDNGVSWELERNDKLARMGKPNRIRVIEWYEERENDTAGEGEEEVSEKDGVKVTIENAGVANG